MATSTKSVTDRLLSGMRRLAAATGKRGTLPACSVTKHEERLPARRLEPIQALQGSPADSLQRALNHVRRSVLREELQVVGSLTAKGEVEVLGTVKGKVSCAALLVGERGRVCGDVKAEDVIVHGQIDGLVEGMHVTLTSHGRVQGDILHEKLLIDEGAIIEGEAQWCEFSGKSAVGFQEATTLAPRAPASGK